MQVLHLDSCFEGSNDMNNINRRVFLETLPGAALLPAVAISSPDALHPDPRQESVPAVSFPVPALLREPWSASWVTIPGSPPFDYGVYHFRRSIDLAEKPSSFVIHVSADNRYQLFANGVRVSWGPARGDLLHWRFESVDIAPQLRAGKNTLAAVVWNYAQDAPQAQVTSETAFILQGNTASERIADTGPRWRCMRNPACRALPVTHDEMRGYFVAGPGEELTAAEHPWGWEMPEFDDAAWANAKPLSPGCPRDASDAPNPWMLVPRTIPAMEEKPERLQRLRRSDGVSVPPAFPAQPAPFEVPPRTEARLLLDQTHLTTAFVELVVSGGKGAIVSLRYAESLYSRRGQRLDKGNRDEIDGKEFIGYRDTFISDGGKNRLFRPLWWRTFRYLECAVRTADEAITIEDLRGVFTGYPFERTARFKAEVPQLDQILDVGWRTARLCAHESYMDCPYYEQLQYVGDTRIQCLVSLYMSGDSRLMRNAIAQINDSRTSEGATMSRAPTRLRQYIPSFSLWWIGMVHDFWMYQDDPEFVRRMLPGVRAVLEYFSSYQKPGGSLGYLPWWRYLDWATEWQEGVPPSEPDGSSAPFDLQLALAYAWAADLEEGIGVRALSSEFKRAEEKVRESAQKLYFDAGRGLYADTPRKKNFSQHTNILALLSGLAHGAEASSLLGRILSDRTLVQCTYYFRHYLHTAVNRTGQGDRYLDLLQDWHAMLDRGLTTWAETPEAPGISSRSDCHAWSAHPNFEIFRTVLGIDSAAPGFKRVLIRPFLGKLVKASGSIPHPAGEVAVDLEVQGEKLIARISLPPGTEGELVWRGRRHRLTAGKSSVTA
jgi:hypothetical protein